MSSSSSFIVKSFKKNNNSDFKYSLLLSVKVSVVNVRRLNKDWLNMCLRFGGKECLENFGGKISWSMAA
jgi:phage tail tube protein FII